MSDFQYMEWYRYLNCGYRVPWSVERQEGRLRLGRMAYALTDRQAVEYDNGPPPSGPGRRCQHAAVDRHSRRRRACRGESSKCPRRSVVEGKPWPKAGPAVWDELTLHKGRVVAEFISRRQGDLPELSAKVAIRAVVGAARRRTRKASDSDLAAHTSPVFEVRRHTTPLMVPRTNTGSRWGGRNRILHTLALP